MPPSPLTDARLRVELLRCETCEARPCRAGCPAGCSPGDFILAARGGEPSDLRRAAAHILGHNPLGGACGEVCPESLCMARCARAALDTPVEIPAIQAAILRRARQHDAAPRPAPPPPTGQRVAVVGAGPAGLGAASVLARAGHAVHVFDRARRAGGMARLIPGDRLDPAVLDADVAGILALGDVHLELGKAVPLPRDLLARGFAAVVVCAGLGAPARLGVPGEARAIPWTRFLARPPRLRGRRVAVVGDGPVALDCAEVARARGAAHVELLARKALFELGGGPRERARLLAAGVHLTGRVRVTAIRGRGAHVTAVELRRLELPEGQAFHPSRLSDLPRGDHVRRDLDTVVVAAGAEPDVRREPHPRLVYAGDLELGPSSLVEAVASGKRAALEVHRLLAGEELASCPDRGACADGNGCPRRATCPEWSRPAGGGGAARPAAAVPARLATELLGRELRSPFVLGGGPLAGGAARVRRAYEAGWAGAVLRGDDLDRLCADVDRLRREFPDRLTVATLDVPAAEDAEAEARAAAEATRRLDAAGAPAVQVGLPPARDGDPLDPARAARLADAALAASAPGVPRLFALPPGAAAAGVLSRLAAAFGRHPGKPAGVTLPAPAGTGEAPGDVARARAAGLVVGCAAGALDHRAAAAVLARGARVLLLEAVADRYGLGVVSELQAGLAALLAERGLRSPADLPGSGLAATVARPPAPGVHPVVDGARCARCGSCTRCDHLALTPGTGGVPALDPARCTGCGACVARCFVGALALATA